MKRKGYIYETMSDWDMIKEAERISVKNKVKNKGVTLHKLRWLPNLIEIQNMILEHRMRTDEYKHEQRISGQNKLRDIAKVNFHPSHIQHQLLVMVCYEKIDKSLIPHTYASRLGYGQHKGAIQMNKWLQEYKHIYKYYFQLDIRKFYDNIRHDLIEQEMRHSFKDESFIQAFMEPFRRFSDGVKIPLGIRPSQICGNLVLRRLDRLIKEKLNVKCYVRYLDDLVGLCETKADCWRVCNAVSAWCEEYGFEIHPPVVAPTSIGIDFLGYKMYPGKGMYWRTSNKKAWLKRRHGVTNKRRLREIDGSAWGFIKHGNRHCKKLYFMKNGVSFIKTGFKKPTNVDANGIPFLEGKKLSMSFIVGQEVLVREFVRGVKTKHGSNRYVLLVEYNGEQVKVITNVSSIKCYLDLMEQNNVTLFSAVFIRNGGYGYEIDYNSVRILEVDHRPIYMDENDITRFEDTNEEVKFNQ